MSSRIHWSLSFLFKRLTWTFDDAQFLGLLGQIAYGVEGGILRLGTDWDFHSVALAG
jgi:hypothetical protein